MEANTLALIQELITKGQTDLAEMVTKALLTVPTDSPGTGSPPVGFDPSGNLETMLHNLYTVIDYNLPYYGGVLPTYEMSATASEFPVADDRAEGDQATETAMEFAKVDRRWEVSEVLIPVTEESLLLEDFSLESAVGDIGWVNHHDTLLAESPVAYGMFSDWAEAAIQRQIAKQTTLLATYGMRAKAGSTEAAVGNLNTNNWIDEFSELQKSAAGRADGVLLQGLVAPNHVDVTIGGLSLTYWPRLMNGSYTLTGIATDEGYIYAKAAVQVHRSQLWARVGRTSAQFNEAEYTLRLCRYFVPVVVDPELVRHLDGIT